VASAITKTTAHLRSQPASTQDTARRITPSHITQDGQQSRSKNLRFDFIEYPEFCDYALAEVHCIADQSCFAATSNQLSSEMKINGFVISMARAGRRMDHVQRIISEFPGDCKRFDATDGRRLSESEIRNVYKTDLFHPRYPFTLSCGEVGCFLSHRSVWKQIAESDATGGLVMEDDIELLEGFSEALQLAVETSPSCGYIQFQTRNFNGIHKPVAKHKNWEIVRPRIVPLRATAEWITRQAAVKLLEVTQVFDRPIDTFIQMRWLHGVDVLVLTPPCVREVSGSLGGSVINERKQKKTIWPQMNRGWKRFVYRQQVGLQSRHAA